MDLMKRHADKYLVSETVNSKATTKYLSCISTKVNSRSSYVSGNFASLSCR